MRTIFTSSLFLIFQILLFSQKPDWEWAVSACDGSPSSVVTDNMGNIYVTGNFDASSMTLGGYTLSNNGNKDIFIAKFDTLGNVVWASAYGGTESDEGKGIVVSDDGKVYVTGIYYSSPISFGNDVFNSEGSYDIFVLQLDSSGNINWATSYGFTDLDRSRSIDIDSDGNIYISGEFKSTELDFDGHLLSNKGQEDVFILKMNEHGNVIWADVYGGTAADYGLDLVVGPYDNIYMTGSWGNASVTVGSTVHSNTGYRNVFLLKMDSSGIVQWSNAIDGNGGGYFDYGKGITTDEIGYVYWTGYYSSDSLSFDTTTLINSGGNDIFLAKYNPNGSIEWCKGYGNSGYEWSYGVAIDNDRHIYINGYFNSSSLSLDTISIQNFGDYDHFIVQFSDNGEAIWAQSIGGSDWDSGIDLYCNNDNKVYALGGFGSDSVTFGNHTLNLCSDADFSLSCLNTLGVDTNVNDTTTTDTVITDTNTSIYNSYQALDFQFFIANNNLNINFNNFIFTNHPVVSIYNVEGRLLISSCITNTNYSLPLANLNYGAYFLSIETKSSIERRVFIYNSEN